MGRKRERKKACGENELSKQHICIHKKHGVGVGVRTDWSEQTVQLSALFVLNSVLPNVCCSLLFLYSFLPHSKLIIVLAHIVKNTSTSPAEMNAMTIPQQCLLKEVSVTLKHCHPAHLALASREQQVQHSTEHRHAEDLAPEVRWTASGWDQCQRPVQATAALITAVPRHSTGCSCAKTQLCQDAPLITAVPRRRLEVRLPGSAELARTPLSPTPGWSVQKPCSDKETHKGVN